MPLRFLPASVRRLLGVSVKSRPPVYALIDRPADLVPFLAALRRVREVALDTEADNMYHYRNRVCLLQFLVEGKVYLIDPLAKGVDLAELWPVLQHKHLIMHGSDFDLRLLHDLCGFRAHSLFDTMLAAQLLGLKQFGLAALLKENFAVALDKSSQKANWSKRPLSQKLLDYASLDVWHLPALRDILTRKLRDCRRLDWLKQQCQAQIEAGITGFAPPTEHDWRIGRSERLRGRGLSVLHAVWHWRDAQARRLDVPPFKVCSNELLLRLANAAEDRENSADEILKPINLGRRHGRLFPSLEAAVRKGCERDPATLPRRPGRDSRYTPLTAAEQARFERIKRERDGVAKQLGFDPTLIANRAQLVQVARDPAKVGEIVLGWQADLLRELPAMKT